MVELTGRRMLNILLVFDAVYFGGMVIAGAESSLGARLSVVECLFRLTDAHAF